jgi:hypothetical protein
MFRSGFSSAKTLSTLSSFNGVVSYLCYRELGLKPEHIAATSARKACGITIPKGQKAKEVVVQFLLDNEPHFVVEYTKSGNIKPQYYDIADSIVIAKAGWELVQQRENRMGTCPTTRKQRFLKKLSADIVDLGKNISFTVQNASITSKN